MARKNKLVRGYSDVLSAGVFGIAGIGALNAVGNAAGPSSAPMLGVAGQAMSVGAVGMPLMATGNIMSQVYSLGEMAEPKRRRRK